VRALTRGIAESPAFNRAIVAVLVINAIALGCRTAESVSRSLDPLLIGIEATVVAIFVVEMVIKITAFGTSFFRDPWNWFDLVVISVSAVPASGTLLMLRTVRILRTFRLISVIPSMRQVVNSLFSALSGIVSILLLLMLVLYTSSIAAVQMFGAIAPSEFGHLGSASLTMFKVMTQGWPEVADQIIEVRPLGWLFFVGYIVLTGFIVLNLLIAVIVNAAERQMVEAQAAKEERTDKAVLAELSALRAQLTRLEDELRTRR
jgi:voltage-gated sodium channel